MIIPIVIRALGTVTKGLVQGLEDYSIMEIGQNTERSPKDLRFAVNQTPVRNHWLMLVWKTWKGIIIIIIIIIMGSQGVTNHTEFEFPNIRRNKRIIYI